MTHIQFAHPQWLWLGAFACLTTIALLARATRLRHRAAASLAGARFVSSVSVWRRLTKQALAVLGVAATSVALARPLAGFRWEEERQNGIDLMFAVDTSKSMLATDLRPDRLTRAKLAVSDLLREFPGERAGLIAFAGDAFVQAPMTIDHDVFGEALDALDTSVITRGGTNIAAPIRAAVEAMATEPDRRKILVLLSDGEDLQGEAVSAAREAARAGLVIYTVGVGTPAGDLIPFERDGVRDVMRDVDGQAVRSRLDEPALRTLAESTGGAYAALGPSGHGLETLYRQHLAGLPRRTVSERLRKVYTERFQIPLAIALGCLLLELSLGERRRRRSMGARRSVPAVGALGLALLMTSMRPAAAAEKLEKGSHAAEANASTYNDGTTAYRRKDFSSAQRQFQDATHTTNLAMQEDAYYDLGNARYRVGQASLAKDRPATIDAWKSALAAYDGALALQPKDTDARFNRDLVKRRLAALQDQQRQDQQKQDPKNQRGDKNEKNQQGAGKQKNQSGKDGQQSQQGSRGQQGQPGSPEQQSAGKPSQSSAGDGQKPPSQPKGQEPSPQQGSAPNGSEPLPGQPQSRAGQTPSQQAQAQHDQVSAPPQASSNQPPQGPGVVSGPPGQRGQRDEKEPSTARRGSGALSTGEAEQLLDSVAGEMKRMPVAGTRRRQSSPDEAPLKDW